ncbi:hypothetical protein ACGGKE_14745 [Sphingobium naphthae]|uniref:hypothetical protein n=1 Tax=Sphingobium naphthae TaxID=1886786 RepID=UPI0037480738
MILGLFLSTAGILLFAWAMLRLAVFALPVWLGLSLFVWSVMGETGVLVGLLLGLVVGVAAFVVGQLIIGSRLPVLVRGSVAALFAIPAGMAGFSVVLGLMTLGGAGALATAIVAGIGAAMIGLAALVSLVSPAPPSSPGLRPEAIERRISAGR